MLDKYEFLRQGKLKLWAPIGLIALIVVGAGGWFIARQSESDVFPPPQMHRAVYDLSLDKVSASSTVESLDGRMVVEWRGGPGCEGYMSDQRVVTNSLDSEGEVSVNDVRLSSWESLDGKEFRYSRTEFVNGEQQTSESGYAHRGAKGVILEQPDKKPETLPADTQFPSVANMKLIAAARKGEFTFSHKLFDGTQNSVSSITAFIGKPGEAAKDAKSVEIKNRNGGLEISAATPWPVHMSYFDESQRKDDGTPNFEMGFRLFPNGVMSTLTLRYNDATVKGELSQLEYFKPGSC